MFDDQHRRHFLPAGRAIHYLRRGFANRLTCGDNVQHVLCAVTITEVPDRPFSVIEFVFQHGLHEQIIMPSELIVQLTSNMIAALYQEVRADYLSDYPAREAARRMRDAELMAMQMQVRPGPPIRFERGGFEWAEQEVLHVTGAPPEAIAAEALAALAREQEAKIAAAEQRSIEYLKSVTTPKQFAEWQQHGYFHVSGGDTGKLYRINRPVGGYNIDELDEAGNAIERLCFIPKSPTHVPREPGIFHTYPLCDVMAIQKLALQLDETATLKYANRLPHLDEKFLGRPRHPLPRPRRPMALTIAPL